MRTPLLLAFCLAALTACLEVEQTVTIRADGSGTQKLKLGMTERAMAAAERHASAMEASSFTDPATIFDARLVRREVTEAGLSCTDVKTFSERRRKFVEVEAEFDRLALLQKSPLNGPGAQWMIGAGKKKGTARLIYYPKGRDAWAAAQKKAKNLSAELSDRERQYFERAKSQMSGLNVVWVVNLPGDVLGTSDNLSKTGTRQVKAVIDEASIKTPKDLILRMAPRFEILFDARGCALPIPRPKPK